MAACNCQLITGVVFLCVGTVFTFISSGSLYWKTYDRDTFSIYMGLYQVCVQTSMYLKCGDIENPKGYLHGTRALVGIAVILCSIASIMSFVHIYKVSRRTTSKAMLTGIVVMAAISVVFLVVANILYGAKFQDDKPFEDEWELGGTFFVNIVAAVCVLIAACFLQNSYNLEQIQPLPGGGLIAGAQPQVVVYHIPGSAGQPMPPAYGQPTNAYGQPTIAYGQPTIAYGQPTNAYGQPIGHGQPLAYGQPPVSYPTNQQPFAAAAQSAYGQPGMGPNYGAQYDNKNAPPPQPPTDGPGIGNNPPPPPAQY